MKLLKRMSLLVVCLSTLLSGCIGEDTDSCPPETETSVLLAFSYPDFDKHIDCVTAAIYDGAGLLVEHRQVDKNALKDFAGIRLDLAAGSYTALCWGNASTHTQIEGLTVGSPLSEHILAHPCYFGTPGECQTNDSLYYARHAFTVLTNTQSRETALFTPAYIRLVVEVQGLESTAGDAPVSHYPFVRVNHLAPAYDHTMTARGSLTTYHPAVRVDSPKKLAESICDVLRFEAENPITIEVLDNHTDNKVLHTVQLQSFIEQHKIKIPAGKEVTIPIRITFDGDKEVIINLIRDWGDYPSIPIPQL